jgi:hypothetical protein
MNRDDLEHLIRVSAEIAQEYDHEATTDIAYALAVVAPEVGNRLEVGREPASQPHQLHVPLAFPFQPAAGLDPVEVAIEVELQEHRGVVRGSAS